MKMTIDRNIFIKQFKLYNREDNFSHKALNELFDYFENWEESTGEEIELDVIAICCDYNEMSFEELRREYPDYKDCTDDEIIGELQQETTIIAHDDDSILFMTF